MAIRFHFQKKIRLAQRSLLKEFINKVFEMEKKEIEALDFIFCDNTYLLNINRNFLDHDYFTDIITFDLSEEDSKKTIAEIYISVDMVKTNAVEFQTTFTQELQRVIFHGVLHLCGYKDKSAKDKKQMRAKENIYLNAYLTYLKSKQF